MDPLWAIDLEGSNKLRNYSRKTLAADRLWVGEFQAFVRSRPTDQLGGDEVRGFLTELAVRHGVAASTQNQAFNARAKSPLDLDPSGGPRRGQSSV